MGQKRTLLCVEDDPPSLHLVERVLARRPQLSLLSARDGSAALTLARQHLPDLILLDLHLPGIDGDQVLRELRADRTTAGIPVVVVTADTSPTTHQRAIDAGADQLLTKPIDVEHLVLLVEELMARSREVRG